MTSDFRRRFRLSERGRRALGLAVPVFLCVLLLRLTGLIEGVGLQIYDAFNRFDVGPSSERVVVIGFGDTDFATYPDYPFSDQLLAEALGKIDAGQPRAVLLNLLRDVPVQAGHEALLERYRAMPNLYGFAGITPLAREDIPAPPVLRDEGRFGFIQSLPDAHDDLTRRTLLGFRHEGQLLESVLLKVVRAAVDVEVRIDEADRLVLGSRVLPAIRADFGEYQPSLWEPLPEMADALLVYSLPFRSARVPVINFAELLSPDFDLRRLQGRVVLIGNSALSLQRAISTPLTATQGRGLSGVELNAALIDNLLAYAAGEGTGLQSLPEWLEYLLLWLVAWLSVWRFMVYRSLWWGMARGGVLLLAVSALGYAAFRSGWWLPLAAIGATLLAAILTVIDNLLRAAAGQRRLVAFMAQIFDRLPEPMYVLDHDEHFRLVNEGFSRLAGAPPAELIGQPAASWLPRADPSGKELVAPGRRYQLEVQHSNMTDEHGRPLTLGLVRSVTRLAEPAEPAAYRSAAVRTALWWAAQGRGVLLLASVRMQDPELVDGALGEGTLPHAEDALLQRLGSAFPDAIDLWRGERGQLLLLLAREPGFDAARFLQLLRQSFAWALRIGDELLELDVLVGVATSREPRATLDELLAAARRSEVALEIG